METINESIANVGSSSHDEPVIAETINEARQNTGATAKDPASKKTGLWQHLPNDVSRRYEPKKPLVPLNGQRELWLVDDTQEKKEVVFKLVALGGFTTQPELITLANSNGNAPRGIPLSRISGTSGTECEIQRFLEGIKLTDWIKNNKPLGEEKARELLCALQRCTEQLVGLSETELGTQWVHCDIKPDNIIVTSEDPLILEMIDFGSAIAVSGAVAKHFRGRTIAYSPPELAHGTAFSNSDLWSIGIIVLEALKGKHPLYPTAPKSRNSLSAEALDIACRTRFAQGWEANKVCVDDNLNAALEGLLTAAPSERWSHQDFKVFVRGNVVQNNPRARKSSRESQPREDFEFEGITCANIDTVAQTMAGNWPWGLRVLNSEKFRTWLRGPAMRADLADAVSPSAAPIDQDMLLLRFIYRVQPKLPPTWQGYSLEPQALLALAAQELSSTSIAASPLHSVKAALRHLALVRAGIVENDSCAQISASWERFEIDYRQAQYEVIAAGAPPTSAITQKHMDAQGLILACDPHRLEALRSELAGAFDDNAARNQWFFIWGRDVSALTPGQICVLRALLHASLASPWSPIISTPATEIVSGNLTGAPVNMVVMSYRFGFHRHLT